MIESSKKLISDLDRLFSRIHENSIIGKLSDKHYSRMANEYEAGQKELIIIVAEYEKQLVELQKQTVDLKILYKDFQEFTELEEFTPTEVNKMIEHIEILNNEKKHS